MFNKFKIIFLAFLALINITYANDLDSKIGQMIIVGFNGDNINSLGYLTVIKLPIQIIILFVIYVNYSM